MAAYYNEIDPYAAQWLRNLIAAGHIAPGDVDERSIKDVKADDLRSYQQAHFFAGIGGWSYALRLAGIPDDRPVWTGSCPCQPFSGAGKRKGAADERHLWPHWFSLIRECGPAVIFGEQVARAIGKTWLDAVAHDLEGQGYAFGAAILPACAVAAPHVRERVWFVADACSGELRHEQRRRCWPNGKDQTVARTHGAALHVADADGRRCEEPFLPVRQSRQDEAASFSDGNGEALAHANGDQQHRRGGFLQMWRLCCESEAEGNASVRRIEWPAEPDLPRVAHGIRARVEQLRAYGNAIVPQVAAEFIKAAINK